MAALPTAAKSKLLMFAAYFDDSGTHADSDVAAVAGYVGPPSEWKMLEAEWNDFLEREAIPFYHAVDCAHGRGHFDKWKGREHAPERDRVHRIAVEIITRRRLTAIGAAVSVPRFNERYVTETLPPDTDAVSKPSYYYCLSKVIYVVGQYMNATAPHDQVSISVEESPKTAGLIGEVFEDAMQDAEWQSIRPRFAGPPTPRPKIGYPQLQAADVLAWEMTLCLRRQFFPRGKRRTRGSWAELATHALKHAEGIPERLVTYDEIPRAKAVDFKRWRHTKDK